MIDVDLVSVVIPAYNTANTINETLHSVRAQTHANLEIIIVDDGSKDDTLSIAQSHAEADSRVRIVCKPNGGVASARNLGAEHAKAEFLAFVDADDLWAPTKIELQLARLKAGGPEMGLVYCWSSIIDADSRVTALTLGAQFEGVVLPELLTNNFIGNGSCALVRRAAFEKALGFEPALRAAGAEGCEDILFYSRVAEHYLFGVVDDFLVGYRMLPDSMSAYAPRMMRSWILMHQEILSRHPELEGQLRRGTFDFAIYMMRRAIFRKQFNQVAGILSPLAKFEASLAFHVCVSSVIKFAGLLKRKIFPPSSPAPKTIKVGPDDFFPRLKDL